MTLGVGDVVRTSVNFQLGDGTLFQNIYHHIFDGIGGVSDAAVTADVKTHFEGVYANIESNVKTDVVEQLSFIDQVEWVVDKWAVVANVGTFTPTFTPTNVADVLPNQISAFIVFKTVRPKSVGRKFLFPAMETEQDAGIIVPATVANLVSFASDALADIVLDVANELHPGIPRTAVNDWLSFTVAIVTNLLGTQRRRRPGYGA